MTTWDFTKIFIDLIPNYLFGIYELSDSDASSLYRHFLNWDELTEILSKPITWKSDSEGYVKISFPIGDPNNRIYVTENYKSEQLPNIFALLGAIYTFYNQSLDFEYLDDNFIYPFDKMKLRYYRRKGFVTFYDTFDNPTRLMNIKKLTEKGKYVILTNFSFVVL